MSEYKRGNNKEFHPPRKKVCINNRRLTLLAMHKGSTEERIIMMLLHRTSYLTPTVQVREHTRYVKEFAMPPTRFFPCPTMMAKPGSRVGFEVERHARMFRKVLLINT